MLQIIMVVIAVIFVIFSVRGCGNNYIDKSEIRLLNGGSNLHIKESNDSVIDVEILPEDTKKIEQLAKTKAEQLEKERAEQEQIAKDKAEAEAKERAKQEQIAKDKAEAEAKEKAEQEQIAKNKAEAEAIERAKQEQIAKDKAEAEAKERAKQEQIAKDKAEAEAIEKAKQEQIAKDKAEAEAIERAEQEQIAKDKAEAKEKAKQEQIAKDKAEVEAKEKAKQEQIAKDKAEIEAKERAEQEQIAKDKAEAEAKERAQQEQIAKDKAEAEAKERAKQEQIAKDKAEAEKLATSIQTSSNIQNIKIPEVPKVTVNIESIKIPEVPKVEKFLSRSEILTQVEFEKDAKDMAISKSKELSKQLEVEISNERELQNRLIEMKNTSQETQAKAKIDRENLLEELNLQLENEKLLKGQNVGLEAKIVELIRIEKEITLKTNLEQVAKQKEIQILLSRTESLESNLTAELENEEILTEANTELETKIAKLLTIAEKATLKAQKEYDQQKEDFATLMSQKESLESNLTVELENEKILKEKNSELESKIGVLAGIVGNNKIKIEEQEIEFHQILSEKNTLDTKITELLTIAEKATIKAKAEQDKKEREFQLLISQKQNLESNLTTKVENEKALKEINSDLENKIAKMLSIAKDATEKAQLEHDVEEEEFQALLSKKESLESNLTTKVENEKALKEINSDLENKIAKMLSIAKDATEKAQLEHEVEEEEFQTLLSKKESLESNLTKEIENEKALETENKKLETRISELLIITEKATIKAQAEQEVKERELQLLISQKQNLESNLTTKVENEKALKEVNSDLENKIAKMLSIAKDATEKAQLEHDVEEEEFQILLSKKESLESNLTKEIENEKALKTENEKLETRISELLTVTEKATIKAKAEQDAKEKELQLLISQKQNLESTLTAGVENERNLKEKNSELESKISELISIAKYTSERAGLEQDAEEKELQLLIFQKQSLESNLTAGIATEKALKKENSKLELKIAELLSKAKDDKTKEQLQLLLTQKEALEHNLTAELKNEKLLKEKNSKLEDKIVKLLNISKESLAKYKVERDLEQSAMESLLSQKQNLEANLTAGVEKEKSLREKNAKLENKITMIEAESKERLADIKAKQKIEFQTLLTQKQNLESNLTAGVENKKLLTEHNHQLEKALEKEKLAMLEIVKLLEELKAEKIEAERIAKEKSELNRVEKENAEIDRLIVQKAQEEQLAKEKAKSKELKKEKRDIAKKRLIDIFALTRVEFNNDSIDLTNESKIRLDRSAKVMKEYNDFQYVIQGHTDNTGKESYNVKLSGQRADKVKEYLISQDVEASILSTKGFGSASPITSNDTDEDRLINRRVVFEIIE